MATKYSDIITLREQKAAYNIQNEKDGDWEMFLTNEQFNDILKKVIASVRNNDTNLHKSFWLEGTYGTGKSHAGAVIKHLLCDPLDSIKKYIDEEYQDSKFGMLRSDLLSLRQSKRLFPVTLYGTQSIAHRDDLSLQVQRSVAQALKAAGIAIAVKTDFDNYITHIENPENQQFWDNLIEGSTLLKSIVPTRQKLVAELQNGDTATLGKVKDVLREKRYDIRMDSADLKQWFFEVQDALAAQTEYDGLFVIWDEFTDLMRSPIGSSILVALQEIDETVMNSGNNSYFFYISHPSALNSLTDQEREKTKGRYHYMRYNMEPVSAFKIMSKKFQPKDEKGKIAQNNLSERFFSGRRELLEVFSRTSTDPSETKMDLISLFPLHPSTANLATYYAREAGSSSRSVFQFIGENPAIRDFLENEKHYRNLDTITADYLWDYVVDEFNGNVTKYGAVTERFNSRKLQVENEGEDYFAVFKSILLLNALNNIANTETVTPSEENIKYLFAGTRIEHKIDDILNYFDENSIIQRLPGGLFSIMFSALPPQEIESAKNTLRTSTFKYTSQVVNFGDVVRKQLDTALKNVARPMRYMLYSEDANESILCNKIENGRKDGKPYEVFVAMLFARDANELNSLKAFASKYSEDERFKDLAIIVFETFFTEKNYERFIEYMANAECALKHNLIDQNVTHKKSAEDTLKEWMNELRRNNFTYYIRGKQDAGAARNLTTIINNVVAPIIFEHGPESLELIQSRYSKTYWQKLMAKEVVKNILSFDDKQDLLSKLNSQNSHINFLLQDSVDDTLQWKSDIDKNHPLWLVSEFIDKKFRHTDKNQSFNLGDKLIELTQPPYGLFQSYAGMGIVAFAMRKYRDQIFDLNGKPRSAQHLVDDIVEMFKAWENGKSSNKLNFRFETKESRSLCEMLITIFKLKQLPGYHDIASLTDARWAITHNFADKQGFPLWSLKYASNNSKEEFKTLIDNILKICGESDMRNPDLINNSLNGLETYQFELGNLLNDPEGFSKGFVNFLKSIQSVEMQDAETDEVMLYLKQHLQGDVGLWNEKEVSDKLKDWRMAKDRKDKENDEIEQLERQRHDEDLKRREEELQQREEQQRKWEEENAKRQAKEADKAIVSADKRIAAKDRVRKISNMNAAQSLLEQICDIGDDIVLDIINNYHV